MRAAIYARYSTGNQSPMSIDDQLRLGRKVAEEQGVRVDHELSDDETSGFTGAAARPGFNRLLELVRRREIDMVIAEHSNRIARDGEAGWHAFNLFKRMGVKYVTHQEAEVTRLKQGVSTLLSELKGEEASHFTRRGLEGVVLAGRSGGGLTYGYRKVRAYDDAGEPLRGLLEIDPEKAAIVERILTDYANGISPLAIATALNREGVPGPRGGAWNASTIAGNADRAAGVIHNELYVGVRVWGRRTFVKDRVTGQRSGRMAEGEPIRQPVPQLRLVSDALWARVRARHAAMSTGPMGDGVRGRGRPKRFLQGMIVCAECGRTMRRAGPHDALRCVTRIEKGACSNGRTPSYAKIEARVIAAIRANLLHPDVVEHVVRRAHEDLREGLRETAKRRAKASAEAAELKRRLERIVDQVEQGVPWAVLEARHAEISARLAAIAAETSAEPDAGVVEMIPSAAGKYRQLVAELAAALDNPENVEALEAHRALIREVRFIPREGMGQFDLEIAGDLAPILQLGQKNKGALADPLLSADVMFELGAGTRVIRRHKVGAPFTIAA
jgi:DNA invertase Pin-like site-specific DNA recombinase